LVFLGSLEDNFTEFRRLKEELAKVETAIEQYMTVHPGYSVFL
jgi:hypothetical protein